MEQFIHALQEKGDCLVDRFEHMQSTRPENDESLKNLDRAAAVIEKVLEASRTNPFRVSDLFDAFAKM